ncbi:MAG: hypothetical protein GXO86_09365 [Chlorobi bacterium]|nr:hypothetical protein [Chlorobiota bacterium]
MKTRTFNTAVLTTLVLTIAFTVAAQDFTFDNEELVDDIPFDTEWISHKVTTEKELATFQFEEEALIDDIPFNTEKIVENYDYRKALNVKFSFSDEQLIDDIPFNTDSVVKQLKGQSNCCPFVVAFTSEQLF